MASVYGLKNRSAVILAALAVWGFGPGFSKAQSADERIEFASIAEAERHASDFAALVKAGGLEEKAIESAKAAIAYDLKDPGSAQFRNLRVLDFQGGRLLCGEINAKNSYGAYVGFTPFYAGPNGGFIRDRETRNRYSPLNAGLVSACRIPSGEGTTTRSCDQDTIRRLMESDLSSAQIESICGRSR